SRKQKGPFLGIGMAHYLFHILNEPHIKHFISLIKDQIFDILEIECLSFDVVNNSRERSVQALIITPTREL
ncbi:unnamed protein product, partial [marine sediment metagenome]